MSVAVDYTEQDQIDLRTVVARVWGGRWWILAIIVLTTVAFGVAAYVMTPIYRATAVLLPASNERGGVGGAIGSALGQLGGLAALAGLNVGGSGSETEEALAVLRSREFTEKFLKERNLMPLLYPEKWDATAKRWRGEKDWPTLAQGFRRFDENVRSVTQDKKTGLVAVQIDWKDPVVAADWANDLVARLNAEMRSRAIANTNNSVVYLQNELARTSEVETRQAISRLMEAQINQRMYANVTEQYSFRIVGRALPPDPKDVVRPRKAMLLALGPLLGAVFGVFVVLIGASIRGALARPA